MYRTGVNKTPPNFDTRFASLYKSFGVKGLRYYAGLYWREENLDTIVRVCDSQAKTQNRHHLETYPELYWYTNWQSLMYSHMFIVIPFTSMWSSAIRF
jgi:hypothetical protein